MGIFLFFKNISYFKNVNPIKKVPSQASKPKLKILSITATLFPKRPHQYPISINEGISEGPARLIESKIIPKHNPPNAPDQGPSSKAQGNNHNSAHLGFTPAIEIQDGENRVNKGTNKPRA